jgi:hypothetical protein
MTNQRSLRALIRHILQEDVYTGRVYDREKLLSNIEAYKAGRHPASAVDPKVAKDAVLDDLAVAFGEEAFDMRDDIQRAIDYVEQTKDRRALERFPSEVKEAFSEFLDTLGITVGTNDDHHLLPGDAEELLKIIVDDLLDGDGRITI